MVGDFNGDGKADVAVSYSDIVGEGSGAKVLLGNGDGTLKPAINSISGRFSFAFTTVGDFNGDGIADLIEGTYVFLGNGDGTFRFEGSIGSDIQYPGPSVVGDFNGGGKADVAIGYGPNGGPYGVSVFLGNGDGTFQTPMDTMISGGASALATGDLNGDGKVDLVASTYGSGAGVLLGNGDGTFQTPLYYLDADGSGYFLDIAVSDFNGDGKADVLGLVGENDDTDVTVMLGNGDGSFQPAVNAPAGGSIEDIANFVLADLNGEGRVDFIEGLNFNASVQLGSPLGPTTTTLESSLNPSFFGASVTLTATVSPSTSSGKVTFYNGSTELGTANLKGGEAAFTLSTLPVGSLSLTATYGGDVDEAPSTCAALGEQVNASPTSTTLLTYPNPSKLNQQVSLIAEIAPVVATGIVTFHHGSAVLGTVPIANGRAIFSTSTFSDGAHSLSAIYVGNTDYDPSVSATVTQIVE